MAGGVALEMSGALRIFEKPKTNLLMKTFIWLLLGLAFLSASCSHFPVEWENIPKPSEETLYPCDNPFAVPDSIVRQAHEAYDSCELPRLTIAFAYPNQPLETGWSFWLNQTSYSTNQDGFVFIEELPAGAYLLDNRQGGWFDYVCGPDAETIELSDDTQAHFVFVQLWCE